jgi:hypothetical protein
MYCFFLTVQTDLAAQDAKRQQTRHFGAVISLVY